MTELAPLSPAAGLLPLEIGQVRVSEPAMVPMCLIAPYNGKETALAEALSAAHDFAWPGPGEAAHRGDVHLIWFGRDQALMIGAEPSAKLAAHAALTDQSDAWTRVMVEGADARAVLARLTPLDMRDAAFPVGSTARTEVFHMQASITRTGETSWQVMGFRSMAGTLVHDLKVAMESVAARAI